MSKDSQYFQKNGITSSLSFAALTPTRFLRNAPHMVKILRIRSFQELYFLLLKLLPAYLDRYRNPESNNLVVGC